MPDANSLPLETDCRTVKSRLDRGEKFLLLDCRERDEHATASIQQATLVPMSELARLAGVPTPTMDALISLASIARGVDFRSAGLTLARMGLAGVSTTDVTTIHRNAIVLRTPQGREIPLASQRRIGEDVPRIRQLLQNAQILSHNVASYFTQRDRTESMRLFTLPFGGVVHDDFVVDAHRVAVGPLFFESPTGAWGEGTYALIVRHSKGVAELPISPRRETRTMRAGKIARMP